MSTTYAAQITVENMPALIADAAKFSLNVDHLQSCVDEAADFGEDCYAILSVNHQAKPKYATFTEMWGTAFHNNWHFTGATHGHYWKVVGLNK